VSVHNDLIRRCMSADPDESSEASVRAILAEAFRTLETVTPEMFEEWMDKEPDDFGEKPIPYGRGWKPWTAEQNCRAGWLAMLRASPLNPDSK
jgi:hypothetical protein